MNEDVSQKSEIARIDVESISRRAIIVTFPIIDTESHFGILNSVGQPLKIWGLNKTEHERIKSIIIEFANSNQETIRTLSEPKIVITYVPLFGDIELRIIGGDSRSPVIVYETHTTHVKVSDMISHGGQNLNIILEQEERYGIGDFSLYTTSERKAVLGDFEEMIKRISADASLKPEEIKQIIYDELQDDLGRDIVVQLSPKGHVGAIRIEINGNLSIFKAGDKMTDFLSTIIRGTRNFEISMAIDDLYLELFEHDDFYLTRGQKGDKEISHRRHENMRILRDTIRNINLKIRRDTNTKYDFITKNGDKYRLNPELNRLKKPRKSRK